MFNFIYWFFSFFFLIGVSEIILIRILGTLWGEAHIKETTGLIGYSCLWSSNNEYNLEGCGFVLVRWQILLVGIKLTIL